MACIDRDLYTCLCFRFYKYSFGWDSEYRAAAGVLNSPWFWCNYYARINSAILFDSSSFQSAGLHCSPTTNIWGLCTLQDFQLNYILEETVFRNVRWKSTRYGSKNLVSRYVRCKSLRCGTDNFETFDELQRSRSKCIRTQVFSPTQWSYVFLNFLHRVVISKVRLRKSVPHFRWSKTVATISFQVKGEQANIIAQYVHILSFIQRHREKNESSFSRDDGKYTRKR